MWAFHRLQLASGHSHLLWHWVFCGCGVDVYSTMVLHGLQRNNLLHHGLLYQQLQIGILSHLKYFITDTLLPSLVGSALASGRSILDTDRTVSVQHGECSRCLLLQTPSTHLLPKFCHVKQYNVFGNDSQFTFACKGQAPKFKMF